MLLERQFTLDIPKPGRVQARVFERGKRSKPKGSGYGTVGRDVTSNIRGPGFESSNQQKIEHLFTVGLLK